MLQYEPIGDMTHYNPKSRMNISIKSLLITFKFGSECAPTTIWGLASNGDEFQDKQERPPLCDSNSS